MICEKCGAAIIENIRVCPQCGTPMRGEEKNITSNSTYCGPLGNTTMPLVWGIIGLGCSVSLFLSVLGIVFSFVGLSRANTYNNFTGYAPSRKVKIGRSLSIAGIIVGFVFAVLLTALIVLPAVSLR